MGTGLALDLIAKPPLQHGQHRAGFQRRERVRHVVSLGRAGATAGERPEKAQRGVLQQIRKRTLPGCIQEQLELRAAAHRATRGGRVRLEPGLGWQITLHSIVARDRGHVQINAGVNVQDQVRCCASFRS